MMKSLIEPELQRLRYRYLAYCVIRDAIGFYFGIPKFLNGDHSGVYKQKLVERQNAMREKTGRELTDTELAKCDAAVKDTIKTRIEQLQEDYQRCETVLFEDNLWLQLLDLDPEFLGQYLRRLTAKQVTELSVVPTWTTRDHSLGRPYLLDERDVAAIHF